jgi:uncharacterized protein YndB with AHSA1/START domain
MSNSRFIYVTYIRSSVTKVWDALTKPEFTRAYWFGVSPDSTWEPGASWKMTFPDGRVADSGEVLEVEKPRRLVLKWRNEFMPELKAEGYTRCTIELEADGEVVKLSITHEIDKPNAKVIEAVSGGWPKILSNLKSLLETGAALEISGRPPDAA